MHLATNPAVSIPWPKTVGLPAMRANSSSWWIGLKSPEAPAYRTRSVRVRCSTTNGGIACPSCTSSNEQAIVSLLYRALGLDRGVARVRDDLAALVPELGLPDHEEHLAPAPPFLLEHVLGARAEREHVAGVDGSHVLELLLAVEQAPVV